MGIEGTEARCSVSSGHFSASVVPVAFGRAQPGHRHLGQLGRGVGYVSTASARPLHLLRTCGIL